MKRFLHRLPLLFVVLLLLTTAVFADMGPKPQLTVVVEHAPSELYYLDLLAEGEYEYDPDFAMDETDLDPELLAAYRAALKGRSKRRAFLCGLCANVCSAALGYFLAEPVWRFVVSIS